MNTFIPTHCPNPVCAHHQPDPAGYHAWTRYGTHTSKLFGKVPRYRCAVCHKTFSEQTFSPTRYLKRPADFETLATGFTQGRSLRAIGRSCSLSCASVATRLARMASGLPATTNPSSQMVVAESVPLPSDSLKAQPGHAYSPEPERAFPKPYQRTPFQAVPIWNPQASVVSEPEGS